MSLEAVAEISGASIFRPTVNQDQRGSFLEIVREELFGVSFVQANHSKSKRRVLRGLHYHQKQSDAWYLMTGRAQVVLADLRDPSAGARVVSLELDGEDPAVLFIPPGIAHGFLALTELNLLYWVTHYYDASDEFGVAWDDPTLNVRWRSRNPILSERDQANPRLEWDSKRKFS